MRVFAGIAVSAAIARKLSALYDALAQCGEGLKMVPAGNLHITLRFLGEIEEKQATLFSEHLTRALAGINPFALQVDGFGCFPDARNPRVLWVGTEKSSDLSELYRCAEKCAMEIGLPPEKDFKGHITVARVKKRIDMRTFRDILIRFSSENWGSMDVKNIIVYQSIIGQSGPTYHPIKTITLGGNPHG